MLLRIQAAREKKKIIVRIIYMQYTYANRKYIVNIYRMRWDDANINVDIEVGMMHLVLLCVFLIKGQGMCRAGQHIVYTR